jgi:hypothetical protein
MPRAFNGSVTRRFGPGNAYSSRRRAAPLQETNDETRDSHFLGHCINRRNPRGCSGGRREWPPKKLHYRNRAGADTDIRRRFGVETEAFIDGSTLGLDGKAWAVRICIGPPRPMRIHERKLAADDTQTDGRTPGRSRAADRSARRGQPPCAPGSSRTQCYCIDSVISAAFWTAGPSSVVT